MFKGGSSSDMDTSQGDSISNNANNKRKNPADAVENQTKVKTLEIVVKVSSEYTSLKAQDPFEVKNWLDGYLGKNSYSVSLDGMFEGILVTCNNAKASIFMKEHITYLGNKVKCERYKEEKFVKGIIFGFEHDFSEDVLVKRISVTNGTKVAQVKRLIRNRVPSNNLVLTFKGTNLPDRVYYGYASYKVKEFVPDPIRCFKCQKFGHIVTNCKSRVAKCAKCGKTDHDYKDCTNDMKCTNCGKNHSAAFRGCEAFVHVKEVLKVKTSGKMSYADAAKQVSSKVQKVVSIPMSIPVSIPLKPNSVVSQSQEASVQGQDSARPSKNFVVSSLKDSSDVKGFDFLTLGAMMIKFMLLIGSENFHKQSWDDKAKQVSDIIAICSDNENQANVFFEHYKKLGTSPSNPSNSQS